MKTTHRKRFDIADLEEADRDQAGFCVACGAYHEGIEPDARKYECEECGKHTVYGAGEIALMGLFK